MQTEQDISQGQRSPVSQIVLDLINSGQRQLAWQLIDHYYAKSDTIENFDILAYLSLRTDKRDTWLRCAEAVMSLALDPQQLFNARCNLIKVYNALNRPEDALFYIDMNLRIDPENFELQCQRAFNISLQGDKQAAEAILAKLLEKYPENHAVLESAFAGKHLREGRTAQGILSFLHSYKPDSQRFDTQLKMQRWTGMTVPGKKIYVEIEGGLGDQIINIRFFDRLKSLGMTPILVSQANEWYRDINRLLRRHGYQVITDDFCIERDQLWTPMMSIPGYLGLTEADLWQGTYITPLRQPKNKLPGTRPRIGIKCSGNPFFAQDEYRKIPLSAMLDSLPDHADIYYIDKDPKEYLDPKIISLSDRIDSWEDTLDFIDQMDCIVSSCTSLVHVAGAMGKTTFVAVPIAEYYTWTSTRVDGSTPWYGNNFFVFKQKKLRDWNHPLAEIRHRVDNFLGTHFGQ